MRYETFAQRPKTLKRVRPPPLSAGCVAARGLYTPPPPSPALAGWGWLSPPSLYELLLLLLLLLEAFPHCISAGSSVVTDVAGRHSGSVSFCVIYCYLMTFHYCSRIVHCSHGTEFMCKLFIIQLDIIHATKLMCLICSISVKRCGFYEKEVRQADPVYYNSTKIFFKRLGKRIVYKYDFKKG
jgi:hypothetical protein